MMRAPPQRTQPTPGTSRSRLWHAVEKIGLCSLSTRRRRSATQPPNIRRNGANCRSSALSIKGSGVSAERTVVMDMKGKNSPAVAKVGTICPSCNVVSAAAPIHSSGRGCSARGLRIRSVPCRQVAQTDVLRVQLLVGHDLLERSIRGIVSFGCIEVNVLFEPSSVA
jgi:hypothetical protein